MDATRVLPGRPCQQDLVEAILASGVSRRWPHESLGTFGRPEASWNAVTGYWHACRFRALRLNYDQVVQVEGPDTIPVPVPTTRASWRAPS